MSTPKKQCPACNERDVQRGHLLCKTCWFEVPPPVRREHLKAYRESRNAPYLTDRVIASTQACIDAARQALASGAD